MNHEEPLYDATPEWDSAPPRFPWPPAEDESVIDAFARTWHGASLEPRTFFRLLPEQGSLGAALLYYLPIGIAVAAADLFWSMIGVGATAQREAVLGGVDMGGLSPVVSFLFSPVLLLIMIFLSAGVVHLLLMLFGGARRDLGFTVRVFAFAYSPQIVAIVPWVGTFIGFVWMVVVAVVGLKEGHGTSTGRVLAAVLVPLIILLFFMAVAMFIMATGELLTL